MLAALAMAACLLSMPSLVALRAQAIWKFFAKIQR
jgi:hypothetical protein